MTGPRAYIRDGAEIYRRSFAIIRQEADLARFTPEEERVAVRIIHACGMVEVAADIAFSAGAVRAGIEALEAGAPILCDSKMVADGITRARLPRDNDVVCALDAPDLPALAAMLGTTRHRGRHRVVAAPAARRRSGDRQCADSPVPAARTA